MFILRTYLQSERNEGKTLHINRNHHYLPREIISLSIRKSLIVILYSLTLFREDPSCFIAIIRCHIIFILYFIVRCGHRWSCTPTSRICGILILLNHTYHGEKDGEAKNRRVIFISPTITGRLKI